MIRIANNTNIAMGITFHKMNGEKNAELMGNAVFKGDYLQGFLHTDGKEFNYCIGIGEKKLTKTMLMELAACGIKFWKKNGAKECYVKLDNLLKEITEDELFYFVYGLCLGNYEAPTFGEKKQKAMDITLVGSNISSEIVNEAVALAEGTVFARDTVNYPGNLLRPKEFLDAICKRLGSVDVEIEILDTLKLKKMGMGGILTVGSSSNFSPYMVILRYRGAGNIDKNKPMGLVGKGVTCDTGGYCLKGAKSMAGIRGDMAGGAAVAGCIYTIAKNKIPVNVTGIIPICENRISPDSYLPGDVITMYDGTRVEVCNTDAEGRLILADAVAYGIKNENLKQVVDIATLTGAVVNMFGFSVAGILCNNEKLYKLFDGAAKKSGERYARIPYYSEHEDMIVSRIGDLKNQGPDYCGTITAGLFIKHFAKKVPWLHMDIAGTAWVDKAIWEFQIEGATGSGVTTLYELCKRYQ